MANHPHRLRRPRRRLRSRQSYHKPAGPCTTTSGQNRRARILAKAALWLLAATAALALVAISR